jgi:hypothetical protein
MYSLQLDPILQRPAAVIGEDPITAGGRERVELQRRVLLERGHTGVPRSAMPGQSQNPRTDRLTRR